MFFSRREMAIVPDELRGFEGQGTTGSRAALLSYVA
jgi:hypothetical protein